MKRVIYYFKHINAVLSRIFMIIGWGIPDKQYLQILYFLKMGEPLHLVHPLTFSEKIQWLKLYNRKSLYTLLVDKYRVKTYVASIIGDKYIIPTIGVWDRPEDVDFDSLPNQFVLKTTHGGGNVGVIICKDKMTLDYRKTVEKLNKSLKQNIYKSLREWPYKGVEKKIMAEEYMEDTETKELRDYKLFAFDGKVKALFVATERGGGNVKFDFFDADFNHLDVVQEHPMSGKNIPKPYCFEEMKEIAEKLSKGFPHVRIDMYEVNHRVFFGEFTFYHHGGVVPFHPKEWDYKFGSWIQLPEKTE